MVRNGDDQMGVVLWSLRLEAADSFTWFRLAAEVAVAPHQVAHRVDARFCDILRLRLGRNPKHFVVDEKRQAQIGENQAQRRAERDVLELTVDNRIALDSRIGQCWFIVLNLNLVAVLD
jgi:hypothetical protein